jgi:hypothetical protein
MQVIVLIIKWHWMDPLTVWRAHPTSTDPFWLIPQSTWFLFQKCQSSNVKQPIVQCFKYGLMFLLTFQWPQVRYGAYRCIPTNPLFNGNSRILKWRYCTI